MTSRSPEMQSAATPCDKTKIKRWRCEIKIQQFNTKWDEFRRDRWESSGLWRIHLKPQTRQSRFKTQEFRRHVSKQWFTESDFCWTWLRMNRICDSWRFCCFGPTTLKLSWKCEQHFVSSQKLSEPSVLSESREEVGLLITWRRVEEFSLPSDDSGRSHWGGVMTLGG